MPYVEVTGSGPSEVWHEVSGEPGDTVPVVLLHGAFAGASSWGAQTPALVEAGFQVYAPERRGHVHTADVPGPLTYSVMADDTIAYLDTVVRRRAHLVGWSDGAVVGALVALRRPELVDRLVLIGQYYNSSGKPGNSMVDELLEAGSEAITFLRAEYDEASPDGRDHFPEVYAKTMQMISTEPEIDVATFAGIQAPTLVLQGDRDEVTVAHSQEVVAAIPDARLTVLPGSHALPIESAETMNPVLLQWLRGGPPEPFF
jgi:pimeloyl-ACP methyl ester carboxylesterase